jgi:hypothetical protein
MAALVSPSEASLVASMTCTRSTGRLPRQTRSGSLRNRVTLCHASAQQQTRHSFAASRSRILVGKTISMFPGKPQENPFPPRSSADKRLTREEWALIVKILSDYQHNEAIRPLYEKLLARSSS